jgi:hypothetical protein
MGTQEIDLKQLKVAVNLILDHLIDELEIESLAIPEDEDFYWSCPPKERYDTSKKPREWWAGRLTDDVGFTALLQPEAGAVCSYSLVNVAPLLRYVGEKSSANL